MKLQHIWDENKPKLEEALSLELREDRLYLLNDTEAWMVFTITDNEKDYLLRKLLNDWLRG